MKIIVTGCAGFIGMHLTKNLLERNFKVIGIDNINNYYKRSLKVFRLSILKKFNNFEFKKFDLNNVTKLENTVKKFKPEIIIHLAAQPGVRYSLDNPRAYISSNINAFFNVLEVSRILKINKLIYASSSSVYGNNNKTPYEENDNTEFPESLYAATKKTNELLAHTYSKIYHMKIIGLRFFTVYGPYGRPDMATWSFTNNLFKNKKIDVYNNGNLFRDFTYIDDIIEGINGAIRYIFKTKKITHTVFNLGNNRPVKLSQFIKILEKITKLKFKKKLKPMQSGDVYKTMASIKKSKKNLNFYPKTNLEKGLKLWLEWFLKNKNKLKI